MTVMKTSSMTLVMALPRNHRQKMMQCPGVNRSRAFRTGVHWEIVEMMAKRTQAVTKPRPTNAFTRKSFDLNCKIRMCNNMAEYVGNVIPRSKVKVKA